jgi:hypothetical protein
MHLWTRPDPEGRTVGRSYFRLFRCTATTWLRFPQKNCRNRNRFLLVHPEARFFSRVGPGTTGPVAHGLLSGVSARDLLAQVCEVQAR